MYESFEQLNGEHSWRDACPDGYVDYMARIRPGGRVAYFNYPLARQMQLIPQNHAERLTPELEKKILDVFALQVGTNSLLKETTAASESLAVAPEGGAQCDNGIDDDGDGVIDDQDPGCHSDGNAGNPNSYVASDNDESNGGSAGTGGSGNNGGNNGNNNNGNGGETQCADGRDNDGDGLVDEDDPGCHEGNNINNPYNADDDSEGSDGHGGGNEEGKGQQVRHPRPPR
jgi:hypothetical protein